MKESWNLPVTRVHDVVASAGSLTFIGGAGDFDHLGVIRHQGIEEQIEGTLENIAAALSVELCSLEDVMRIKVFHDSGLGEWSVVAAIARAFGQQSLPTISTLPVPLQPFEGQLVQIQVIAQRGWRQFDDIRIATQKIPPEHKHLFETSELSSALRAGEFITVANRTSSDAGLDAVAQSHNIMESMNDSLATVGASLQDSVKMEGYYFGTTRDQWRPLAQARASHFREPGPVATVVPCHALSPEGATTKIEVMAMRERRATFDKYIPREDYWPPRVWDWPVSLPYRQAIRLRDVIWLGGQVPSEPFTNSGKRIQPPELQLQTRFTMSYVDDLLRGFGRCASDLKFAVCYFTSRGTPEETRIMVELLADCMGGVLPPITLVPQPHMHTPDSMVEIWGVAQG